MLPDWIEPCRLFGARSVDFLRIALLTHIPGVEFETAWQHRTPITLDGVVVPLIGRDDLITNKRAVGRLQDLADVEALEAVGSANGDG